MRVAKLLFLSSLLISHPVHSQVANSLLADISAKYPPINSATHLLLTGDVDRSISGHQEIGKATFEVSSDGSSTTELIFSSMSHKERHTALGERRTCHWKDTTGEEQETKSPDCERFLPWFAPMLIGASGPSNHTQRSLEDKGLVSRKSRSLHQVVLRTQLRSSNAHLQAAMKDLTRADLFFDPESLLLESVDFDLHGEVNWNQSIKVHVVYSDYHLISGFPTPYTIARYVNGVHELTVHITSASVQ